MPKIISSTTLRNDYNGVSSWCHETTEPAFVTKNGAGDLAVMSMDAYEQLVSRIALYEKLAEGWRDVQEGRVRPAQEVLDDVKQKYGLA